MKIYILERDNFEERPNPQVFINGYEALETVRKEFKSKLANLGISDEFAEYEIDEENGYSYCWFIDNSSHCGDCMISDVHGSDEWSWRITEHDIPNASEEEKPWYIEKWYDDDLIGALEYRVIEPTDENIEMLRDACKEIFNDKSERNEMIDAKVYELFGENGRECEL